MSQTLKFTIEVEVGFYDNEYALRVQNKFTKALLADIPEELNFKELNKIMHFEDRQYFVKSIHFPELNRNADEKDNRFEIESVTEIEIRG